MTKVEGSSGPKPKPKDEEREEPKVTVKEGQSLKDVARENKTTEEELLKLNPHIKPGADLKTGQDVRLPSAEAAKDIKAADKIKHAANAGVADVASKYGLAADGPAPQTAMPAAEQAPLPGYNPEAATQLARRQEALRGHDHAEVTGSILKPGGVRDRLQTTVASATELASKTSDLKNDLRDAVAAARQSTAPGMSKIASAVDTLHKKAVGLDQKAAALKNGMVRQQQAWPKASPEQRANIVEQVTRGAVDAHHVANEALGLKQDLQKLNSEGSRIAKGFKKELGSDVGNASRLAQAIHDEGKALKTSLGVAANVASASLKSLHPTDAPIVDKKAPDGKALSVGNKLAQAAQKEGSLSGKIEQLAQKHGAAAKGPDGLADKIAQAAQKDPAGDKALSVGNKLAQAAQKESSLGTRIDQIAHKDAAAAKGPDGLANKIEQAAQKDGGLVEKIAQKVKPEIGQKLDAGARKSALADKLAQAAKSDEPSGGMLKKVADRVAAKKEAAADRVATEAAAQGTRMQGEPQRATASRAGAAPTDETAGASGPQAAAKADATDETGATAKPGETGPTDGDPPLAGLTEEEAAQVGKQWADGTQKPPQTLWNEHAVNVVNQRGQEQGGISEERMGKNAQLAADMLNPDGAGGEKKEVSAADMAAAARSAGVPLEKQDPAQLQAAANYVNEAKDLPEQQERMRKALNNFNVLNDKGMPQLQPQEAKDLMWGAAKVPGHAMEKMSAAQVNAEFQKVAGAVNTPGDHALKVGKHNVKLSVNDSNTVTSSSTKKPGLLSKIGGAIKKVAPIVLKVASFVPGPIGIAARVVNGVVGAVKAIKSGNWLGAITAAAGAVGAGALGAAGKLAGNAAKVASTVGRVANGISQTARGIQSIKQGGLAGVIGGIAGVAGGVAAGIGDAASKVSGALATASKHLGNAAQGIGAAQNVRAAGQAVDGAKQALAQARASGDPAAIAQAQQQLDSAERNKRSALLGAASTAASIGASYAPTVKGADGRPIANGRLGTALNITSRGLNTAQAVNNKDLVGAAISGASLASDVQGARGKDNRVLNEASTVAGGLNAWREASKAEGMAKQGEAQAQQALDAARRSGDPAAIRQAEKDLKTARLARSNAELATMDAQNAAGESTSQIIGARRDERRAAQEQEQARQAAGGGETAAAGSADGTAAAGGGSTESTTASGPTDTTTPTDDPTTETTPETKPEAKPAEPTTRGVPVKSGDALEKIAAANGVTVAELRAANPNIKGDLIRPGDVIQVPLKTSDEAGAKALKEFRDRNPNGLQSTKGGNYQVKNGETVSSILKDNPHLTEADLRRLNPGIGASGDIGAGQTLNVPGKEQVRDVKLPNGQTQRQIVSTEQLAREQTMRENQDKQMASEMARLKAQNEQDRAKGTFRDSVADVGMGVASSVSVLWGGTAQWDAASGATRSRDQMVDGLQKAHEAYEKGPKTDADRQRMAALLRGAGGTVDAINNARDDAFNTTVDAAANIAITVGTAGVGAAAGAAAKGTSAAVQAGARAAGSTLGRGVAGAVIGGTTKGGMVAAGGGTADEVRIAVGSGAMDGLSNIVGDGISDAIAGPAASTARRLGGRLVESVVGDAGGNVMKSVTQAETFTDEKGNARSAAGVAGQVLSSSYKTYSDAAKDVKEGNYMKAALSVAGTHAMSVLTTALEDRQAIPDRSSGGDAASRTSDTAGQQRPTGQTSTTTSSTGPTPRATDTAGPQRATSSSSTTTGAARTDTAGTSRTTSSTTPASRAADTAGPQRATTPASSTTSSTMPASRASDTAGTQRATTTSSSTTSSTMPASRTSDTAGAQRATGSSSSSSTAVPVSRTSDTGSTRATTGTDAAPRSGGGGDSGGSGGGQRGGGSSPNTPAAEAQLRAQGVQVSTRSTTGGSEVVISTEGNHPLNKMAREVKLKNNTELVYDASQDGSPSFQRSASSGTPDKLNVGSEAIRTGRGDSPALGNELRRMNSATMSEAVSTSADGALASAQGQRSNAMNARENVRKLSEGNLTEAQARQTAQSAHQQVKDALRDGQLAVKQAEAGRKLAVDSQKALEANNFKPDHLGDVNKLTPEQRAQVKVALHEGPDGRKTLQVRQGDGFVEQPLPRGTRTGDPAAFKADVQGHLRAETDRLDGVATRTREANTRLAGELDALGTNPDAGALRARSESLKGALESTRGNVPTREALSADIRSQNMKLDDIKDGPDGQVKRFEARRDQLAQQMVGEGVPDARVAEVVKRYITDENRTDLQALLRGGERTDAIVGKLRETAGELQPGTSGTKRGDVDALTREINAKTREAQTAGRDGPTLLKDDGARWNLEPGQTKTRRLDKFLDERSARPGNEDLALTAKDYKANPVAVEADIRKRLDTMKATTEPRVRDELDGISALARDAGADVLGVSVRTKSADSMTKKMQTKANEGRDYAFGSATDLVGGRIVVKDMASLERVMKEVESKYGSTGRILEKENKYVTNQGKDNPYRAVHYIIEQGGETFELQLKTESSMIASDLYHNAIYKKELLNLSVTGRNAVDQFNWRSVYDEYRSYLRSYSPGGG